MMKAARSGLFKEIVVKEPVTDLNLNWLTGNVALLPGEDENVYVRQWADPIFGEQKLMKLIIIGKSLSIADGRKKSFPLGFNLGRTGLEVVLPARQLRSMTITSVGGKLLAENLSVHHCQCAITAGTAELSGEVGELEFNATGSTVRGSHLKAEKLYFRSVSTKSTFAGHFRHIDAGITGRSLQLECLTMPEGIHTISTAAKTVISLPREEGFEARVDAKSGRFIHAFAPGGIKEDTKQLIYRNGGSPIHIGIRGGSVHLKSLV
ncbi:DUF4097 family beta strand repeat-containing protein [Paenibacillus sp. CAU 1782]